MIFGFHVSVSEQRHIQCIPVPPSIGNIFENNRGVGYLAQCEFKLHIAMCHYALPDPKDLVILLFCISVPHNRQKKAGFDVHG